MVGENVAAVTGRNMKGKNCFPLMMCRVPSSRLRKPWLGHVSGMLMSLLTCAIMPAAAQNGRVNREESIGAERAAAALARVKPRMVEELRKKGLHWGDPVYVRAFKEQRLLELWVRHRESGKFRLFKNYPVAAQSGELGPKLAEGDGQVPEGFYSVGKGSMKPDSQFHLAFNIGYPNAFDRHHGRTGSLIMIHGGRASIGCLAMTDAGIEEIYSLCAAALADGQPFFRVHVFPFRMTDLRMKQTDGHRWAGFWRNLRRGYDAFEQHGVPPDATLKDGQYAFGPE
jgi:murein L,D-transpeptidase YafK